MRIMKKGLVVVALALLLALSVSASAHGLSAQQSLLKSGKGTKKKPYIIKTADQWNYVAGNVTFAKKHFKLGANIRARKLRAWNWGSTAFSGSLDGKGKRITSCTFIENTYQRKAGKKTTSYYSGATAITSLKGATVKNLIFKDCRFVSSAKGTHSRAAASPFYVVEKSTIQAVRVVRCTLKSTHASHSAGVGGLAHSITKSSIKDCVVQGSTVVSASGSAAGVAVQVSGSELLQVASASNSITSKSLLAQDSAAGLACVLSDESVVSLCSASHNTIKASVQAAGLLGAMNRSRVEENYVRFGQVLVSGECVQKAAGFCLSGTSTLVMNSYVYNTSVTAQDAQVFGFGDTCDLFGGFVKNCYSHALLFGAEGKRYPFMSNGNADSEILGVDRCFGTYREGYNSVTGGAWILAPGQILVDSGDILNLGDGVGIGKWVFSNGSFPNLVRNP